MFFQRPFLLIYGSNFLFRKSVKKEFDLASSKIKFKSKNEISKRPKRKNIRPFVNLE